MEAGTHPQVTTINGQTVRYTLSVPEGLAPGAPLVLCLHYAGHGTPWYGAPLLRDLVEPALRATGAVMVAPDCPGRSWTAGGVAETVLALLDAVAAQHATDPRRVVVAGYSMGGIGAWHYAAAHPERFSAAIPMAGRPGPELPTIPVYIVHGRRDEVIAIGPDEAAAAALEAAGATVAFRPLEGVTHYQIPQHAAGLVGIVPWLASIWSPPG